MQSRINSPKRANSENVLSTSKDIITREEPNLYIKLTFGYAGWSIAHCAGGCMAAMLAEPEIISVLPVGVIPDKYSKRLKSLFGKQDVSAGFFHDCGKIGLEKVKEALNEFRSHYNNFENGYPATALGGSKPRDNEFIANLITAVNNVSVKPSQRQPFITSEDTANSAEEFLSNQCF